MSWENVCIYIYNLNIHIVVKGYTYFYKGKSLNYLLKDHPNMYSFKHVCTLFKKCLIIYKISLKYVISFKLLFTSVFSFYPFNWFWHDPNHTYIYIYIYIYNICELVLCNDVKISCENLMPKSKLRGCPPSFFWELTEIYLSLLIVSFWVLSFASTASILIAIIFCLTGRKSVTLSWHS